MRSRAPTKSLSINYDWAKPRDPILPLLFIVYQLPLSQLLLPYTASSPWLRLASERVECSTSLSRLKSFTTDRAGLLKSISVPVAIEALPLVKSERSALLGSLKRKQEQQPGHAGAPPISHNCLSLRFVFRLFGGKRTNYFRRYAHLCCSHTATSHSPGLE